MFEPLPPLSCESLLSKIQKGCFALTLCTFLFLFVAVSGGKSEISLSPNQPLFKNLKRKEWNIQAIGVGALALNQSQGAFAVPNLERDLLLLSIPNKPGAASAFFWVGLAGSKQIMPCEEGRLYYLTYSDKGLAFSEGATPFKVRATLKGGKAFFEAILSWESGSGKVMKEGKTTFETSPLSPEKVEAFLGPALLDPALVAIQNAKCLGSDKLYELYGGEEFAELKGKQRLLIAGLEENTILPITTGALLYYEEGKWQPLTRDKQTEKYALAKIVASSPHKVEIEIWDQRALLHKTLTLSPERPAPLKARLEETFSKIRPRTTTSVSIKFDQRSHFLKVGDWVLNGENGWRILKTWDEVERALSYQENGELFVFDGVEKSQGKGFFCGHLFDPSRSYVQSVRLPLAMKKEARAQYPTGRHQVEMDPNMGSVGDEELDDERVMPPPPPLPPPPAMKDPYNRR